MSWFGFSKCVRYIRVQSETLLQSDCNNGFGNATLSSGCRADSCSASPKPCIVVKSAVLWFRPCRSLHHEAWFGSGCQK